MEINRLLERYLHNDIRALAKILSIIESRGPDINEIMSKIASKEGKSYCLGITGPPGSGKSTLADGLTHILRKEGRKVGIVAIDPSSPFSGGAVLGDRIRMQDHAGDSGVFIRSLGSRGSHGGLSRATRDIVRAMSAFGFDYVIVETVGVGQTELDIMELADTTAVVLVPEAGDTIQTMKAGLFEIADIFVVNKCDRPGGDQIVYGLETLVEMNQGPGWKIPIIKTEALHSRGLDEFYQTVKSHRKFVESDEERTQRQARLKEAELIQIILELFEKDLIQKIATDKELSSLLDKVKSGSENSYSASKVMLERMLK